MGEPWTLDAGDSSRALQLHVWLPECHSQQLWRLLGALCTTPPRSLSVGTELNFQALRPGQLSDMEPSQNQNLTTSLHLGSLKTDQYKISPSQIKVFQECPRKWGFRYIDGIDTPPGKGAILGSAVHKELEHWFTYGEWMDDGDDPRAIGIARVGVQHYPEPHVSMQVEPQINFEREGILYRGYVDIMDDHDHTIHDHKTTRDPKKYALNTRTILTDPQALIYSVFGFDFWETDSVGLQWTYFKTVGKPITFPIRATVSREDTRKRFDTIVAPTAKAITKALDSEEANDLPADPTACGNFGGCPHAAYCKRTQDELITSVFGTTEKEQETENMGLKEKLLAKRAAAAGQPPPGGRADPAPSRVSAKDKLPPPRVDINPPEAPGSVEKEQAISRYVEKLTGSPAKKKEKAKILADSVHGLQSETTLASILSKTFDRLETATATVDASTVPSPKAEDVLAWVCEKTHAYFVSNRSKHTDAAPFVHGRTLLALKTRGWVNIRKDYPEQGQVTVRATDAGMAQWTTTTISEGVVEMIGESLEAIAEEGSVKELPDTVEVSHDGDTVEVPAGKTARVEDPDSGVLLVAVWKRINGKISIEIDPSVLGVG